MRIIQINAVYGVGSTGHIVQDIHEMLCAEGHESYVFWATACVNADDPAHFYQIGSKLDHKIHAVLRRIGKDQGWHSKLATKAACEKIKLLKPEVVHLHNLHSNYIHLPTLLKCLGEEKISVLITLHDCWYYTGYCTLYQRYGNCEQWRDGCSHCPAVSRRYQSRISRIFKWKKELFSQIEYLYCNGVSRWTTLDGQNSPMWRLKDCSCIYNWIDTDIFKPYSNRAEVCLRYGLPTSKKIVLGVAQGWSDEKGLREFRELSNRLSAEAVVVLVGKHNGLQSDDNLRFVGYTKNQRELAELYAAADIFVNPSSFETFGLVTAESMACGTPVVAYRNTGTAELVTEACGVLVENQNVGKLIEAVEYLLSRTKADYSIGCVKNVACNFEKRVQLDKYLSLYRKIVDKDTVQISRGGRMRDNDMR